MSDIEKMIAALPVHEQERLLQQVADYKAAVERENCQARFLPFVKKMWPGFIHGRHHAVVAKAFEDVAEGKIKRLAISMPPRHAILTSMKIPTLAGMKTMADLVVGDFVFGPDGRPVEVLGKSQVFEGRQLYRVTTDDGASLVVDAEHLWTVRLDRKAKNWRDYTTEDLWLRQNGWMVRKMPNGSVQRIKLKGQNEARLPMLPAVRPAEYEEKPLLIDPYVLGVWLGDGSKSSAVITCHDDDAVFMRAEIERRYYKTTDQATKFTFGVLGLQAQIKQLGLHKNKHIPREYLEASPSQRRDLLKGLMDTDGNVSKAGQCFFAQSNREFIEQVAELIRSLGIKANIIESEARIGDKSYGKTWRISFYASDVFLLPRKEVRTLKGERKFGRYIKIEKLQETGNTQCIKVDRDDGLFLAGEGYICTHNTKSEFGSFLFPAWFLGKFPDKKVMQSSNTSELAVGFGRKVRNLVDSEQYHEIFPNVKLRQDSKSAGRWAVNQYGEYFAIGVGGTMTGRGADVVIIDDPHSEQEAALAAHDPSVYDSTYEWYTSGPRQRLQPNGAIIIIATRWGDRDLIGRVLKDAAERGKEDEWRVIEFPAILPSGNPLWPEFWPLNLLEDLKAELPPAKWNAQYQQSPTGEEGAIVKREWWKVWEKDDPPPCSFIIQSWDTAFTKNERSDFSACTTWGVFNLDEDERDVNIILLDAFQKRMEFPELKDKAFTHYKEWEPDACIVEAKAAGAPLVFELRTMGIPVSEYTPSRGKKGQSNDKIARLNSVADLFRSGKVWAPDTRWAREVIEQMAAFPNAAHDDLVDSSVQALMRFRQGGFLRLESDEPDEQKFFRRKTAFY
jgi:predicted phage terminase large subunit-like protein